jgi:hypothetical protein
VLLESPINQLFWCLRLHLRLPFMPSVDLIFYLYIEVFGSNSLMPVSCTIKRTYKFFFNTVWTRLEDLSLKMSAVFLSRFNLILHYWRHTQARQIEVTFSEGQCFEENIILVPETCFCLSSNTSQVIDWLRCRSHRFSLEKFRQSWIDYSETFTEGNEYRRKR